MTNQRNRDVPEQRQRRIRLRQAATELEQILWRERRGGQIAGAKFRRQHQIGQYIVDFYCHEHRLVVEVDGSQHFDDEALEYDDARSRYLESLGLRVLRFTNAEVARENDAVLARIWDVVTPSPEPAALPSPRGRGNRPVQP